MSTVEETVQLAGQYLQKLKPDAPAAVGVGVDDTDDEDLTPEEQSRRVEEIARRKYTGPVDTGGLSLWANLGHHHHHHHHHEEEEEHEDGLGSLADDDDGETSVTMSHNELGDVMLELARQLTGNAEIDLTEALNGNPITWFKKKFVWNKEQKQAYRNKRAAETENAASKAENKAAFARAEAERKQKQADEYAKRKAAASVLPELAPHERALVDAIDTLARSGQSVGNVAPGMLKSAPLRKGETDAWYYAQLAVATALADVRATAEKGAQRPLREMVQAVPRQASSAGNQALVAAMRTFAKGLATQQAGTDPEARKTDALTRGQVLAREFLQNHAAATHVSLLAVLSDVQLAGVTLATGNAVPSDPAHRLKTFWAAPGVSSVLAMERLAASMFA